MECGLQVNSCAALVDMKKDGIETVTTNSEETPSMGRQSTLETGFEISKRRFK